MSTTITRSVPVISRDGATLTAYQFADGETLLGFDAPGVTLSIHLTAAEAAALRDALATPAEETV